MSCVSSNKSARNYGIDLLRLVAMLCIVTLHTLYHGKIVDSSCTGSMNYYISTFLLTAVWCGVDVFALISGFVGYQINSPFRWAGFLRLWLQVVFYSAGICVLFYWILPGSVSKLDLLKSFAPLTTRMYWYFSAYFFVVLSAPLVNKLVANSSVKKLVISVISGLCVLYISHLIPGTFGTVLLVYLYFIGACLSKHQHQINLPKKWYVIAILGLLLFTWSWRIYWEPVKPFIGGLWLRNDSPTMIGISLCLVLLFGQVKPTHTLFLSLITPSIFSVYLFNDHFLIRKYVISEYFRWLTYAPWYVLVLCVVGFSVLFLIAAVVVDLIRRQMEIKVHIPMLIKQLQEKFHVQ